MILIVTETRIGGDQAKEITEYLKQVGQEIHVVVTVRSSHLSSLLFSIYASPKCSELCIFWTNLAKFASTMFVVAYGRRL